MIYNIENPKDLELIGIHVLNIYEAAALITKCLYCEGDIELDDKIDFDEISIFSMDLDHALKAHTEKFIKILVKAIENKSLPIRSIRRDLDETLIPEDTYINSEDLEKWLEERNIGLGDLYYDDYISFESDLMDEVDHYVENKRSIKKNPEEYKKFQKSILEHPDSIFSSYINSQQKSSVNYESTVKEKPLHKKEKDSLLKLFIGMAVSNYGLDNILNNDVKASEISKDIRLNSGIDMDDDTIRKYLKKGLDILKKHQ
jgi:hypothetical protein